MAHARLGPSNHRWPHCPGSVREEANYENVSGAAAVDGTGSHLLLEMCLDNNVNADQYLGQIIGVNHHDSPNGWLIQEDRAARVQECLDYITRRHGELSVIWPGSTITVEAEGKADAGGMFGRTDWWGTVDITISVMNAGVCNFIEIIDYKDGRMWVNAENNSQLIAYAGGRVRPHIASGPDLVRPFRPERVFGGVRLTIVQPKTNPSVRYQELTTGDLVERLVKLSVAARMTDDPEAPLVPDSKGGKGYCGWCLHKKNCNAGAIQSLQVMENMNEVRVEGGNLFEVIGQAVGDVKLLTADQLADLADARAGITAAFDRVDAEILTRVEQDIQVPGYAMGYGNSSRVWGSTPEEVEKVLKGRRWKKADIYPAKLISPAAMMNSDLLTPEQKKRIEAEHIVEKAGKLTLKKVGRGNETNRVEKDTKEMFDVAVQPATDVQQSEPVTDINFF